MLGQSSVDNSVRHLAQELLYFLLISTVTICRTVLKVSKQIEDQEINRIVGIASKIENTIFQKSSNAVFLFDLAFIREIVGSIRSKDSKVITVVNSISW
jgi:hypothetical protein